MSVSVSTEYETNSTSDAKYVSFAENVDWRNPRDEINVPVNQQASFCERNQKILGCELFVLIKRGRQRA